jgi:hypothetical protein
MSGRVLLAAAVLAVAPAAAAADSAAAAMPARLQGTFTRSFSSSDFPAERGAVRPLHDDDRPVRARLEGEGTRRLQRAAEDEQLKTSGALLLVRDKPGSLGRLCAQNGWGRYRYAV